VKALSLLERSFVGAVLGVKLYPNLALRAKDVNIDGNFA
jgi:hypothetical protein